MRVLVLGGTGEARALALRLVAAGADVISSLAGHTTPSVLPAGQLHVGGFGGIDGLTDYLRSERIDCVIDATHPFAAIITQHAVEACRRAGVRLLILHRPGWRAEPGDRWIRVPHMRQAARVVRASAPGAVLLTTGRGDLAAFADDDVHEFIVRTIVAPSGRLPPRTVLVSDRGPYDIDSEIALMRRHGIGLLVTKDSGGAQTSAKLLAARTLRLAVVVVDRPALPRADMVPDVDAALAWATRDAAARDQHPMGASPPARPRSG